MKPSPDEGRYQLYTGFIEAPACVPGGCDGKKGVNTLVTKDGEKKTLPGKTTVKMKAGVSGVSLQ